MKLSAWAKSQGITYLTAYRWFRGGTMPVPCYQTAGGTIIVDVEGTGGTSDNRIAGNPGAVALYARVSGHDQRDDLERQVVRLRTYANEKGLKAEREVKEIASGLNGHRAKLLNLLADPAISVIVVEHRDRLMRFGSDYIEAALAASGRSLVIVDATELKDDVAHDMIDVLTGFCAHLYGRKSSSRRAKAAVSAMEAAE